VSGATVHLANGDSSGGRRRRPTASGVSPSPTCRRAATRCTPSRGRWRIAPASIRYAATPVRHHPLFRRVDPRVVKAQDGNGRRSRQVAPHLSHDGGAPGADRPRHDSHTIETADDAPSRSPTSSPRPYVLSVYKKTASYGSKTVRGEIVVRGSRRSRTSPSRTDATGTIRGVVLDQDGVTPAAGATLVLHHPALANYTRPPRQRTAASPSSWCRRPRTASRSPPPSSRG